MPGLRFSTGCWRADTRERSSCASRTPTWSARRAPQSSPFSKISGGSACSGTKALRRAATSVRIARASGWRSTSDTPNNCCRPGRRYHCFCTPETLDAQRKAALAGGLPPKYAGTCRHLTASDVESRRAAGEPAAVRLRVPEHREVSFTDLVRGPVTFHTDVIGDPVLVRSDGIPAYNYAVVIDDALMKVTHVIRGEDHISNTPRQILVYEMFGWTPPSFAHLSLVMGPDHAPLSKRHGATSVAEFRAKGYLPEALFNYLALIGWSPGQNEELLPADELARRFRLESVAHGAGIFDEDKLAWANRHYLKAIEPDRLATLAVPFLTERGQISGDLSADAVAWLRTVLPGMASSIDRLPQLSDRLDTVFRFDAAASLANESIAAELSQPSARAVVRALAEDLRPASRLIDRDTFRAAAARVKDASGQKGKALFHPIRLALTGAQEGPELDLIVPAIDRAADLAESGLARVIGCRERAAAMTSLL